MKKKVVRMMTEEKEKKEKREKNTQKEIKQALADTTRQQAIAVFNNVKQLLSNGVFSLLLRFVVFNLSRYKNQNNTNTKYVIMYNYSEMFRRLNEIKRWIASHSVWGKVINHTVSIEKLKKINTRLNCAFLIPNTAFWFVPLITRGYGRAEVAPKTTTINKKKLPKTRVLLLYIQNVCEGDRFYGCNKKEITEAIKALLQEKSEDEKEFKRYDKLTIGCDFETEIYSQLRYQTFLINKSGKVEDNGKIRVAICFKTIKRKNQAKKILKAAAKSDKWEYPWRVYEMKPKQHFIYFDTDIFSMMIHWLSEMNLEGVCAMHIH